ncbi:iron-containing alcohol dehydrogenase family protein [Acerihabitans sp. TG2]|uniref:iron-containing alcohol dehydrogenase family protein n=1 Tax=Acerihabitans sp. TG2 TaxID=3096008 RepID=UPI002B230C47|nr:iron-containing alcohol dehydrogenase family protein [Acerihabitans sp. TG2]MEA9390424.1 iron-containing alcohol dehydrogenase family protein [Acerihabitans sp. TG2]
MQTQTIIFPAHILRGPGVLSRLGDVCGTLGRRALLIGGHQALAAVAETIKSQLATGPVTLVGSTWFGGECSETQILRLTQLVLEQHIDLIIGAGGGKALDTTKAVGVAANVPVVTVPTIAATCAAVTPLSIRYFDDGRFQDLYPLAQAPAAVFIDSDLLVRAPMRWLAAGLGDTLAKWYEFRAISTRQTALVGIQRASQANSLICYDLIATYGAAACQAVRDGRANPALDQVLDAIFMFAGLTSLMSNGAHAAAAHAMYEGFTVCHKTHDFGHGLLVGFGNLCLLALENRADDELRDAMVLAKTCAVPLRLSEIADLNAEELESIVQASVQAPDMANMPGKVTATDLYTAIRRVEAMAETIL